MHDAFNPRTTRGRVVAATSIVALAGVGLVLTDSRVRASAEPKGVLDLARVTDDDADGLNDFYVRGWACVQVERELKVRVFSGNDGFLGETRTDVTRTDVQDAGECPSATVGFSLQSNQRGLSGEPYVVVVDPTTGAETELRYQPPAAPPDPDGTTLGGTGAQNVVIGTAGTDDLDGGAGNDYLVGKGNGESTGEGADVVNGGPGNDIIDVCGGEGSDFVVDDDGIDVAVIDPDTDYVLGFTEGEDIAIGCDSLGELDGASLRTLPSGVVSLSGQPSPNLPDELVGLDDTVLFTVTPAGGANSTALANELSGELIAQEPINDVMQDVDEIKGSSGFQGPNLIQTLFGLPTTNQVLREAYREETGESFPRGADPVFDFVDGLFFPEASPIEEGVDVFIYPDIG